MESLKNARKLRGMSQFDLSVISGIDQSKISRIETGHGVTVKTLKRLADALDMRLVIEFKEKE